MWTEDKLEGDVGMSYGSDRYYWLKEHGICVMCGNNDAFPGYVKCPECIEKVGLASRRCWANKEKRIRYNKHGNERKKKLILERKEKGMCPKCGKPVRNEKYIYCARCREKKNAARRAKNSRRPGEHFRDRIEAGVCMYCGSDPVPGYKLCEKCLEKRRCINNKFSQKSSEKWRKEIVATWNSKKRRSENG